MITISSWQSLLILWWMYSLCAPNTEMHSLNKTSTLHKFSDLLSQGYFLILRLEIERTTTDIWCKLWSFIFITDIIMKNDTFLNIWYEICRRKYMFELNKIQWMWLKVIAGSCWSSMPRILNVNCLGKLGFLHSLGCQIQGLVNDFKKIYSSKTWQFRVGLFILHLCSAAASTLISVCEILLQGHIELRYVDMCLFLILFLFQKSFHSYSIHFQNVHFTPNKASIFQNSWHVSVWCLESQTWKWHLETLNVMMF